MAYLANEWPSKENAVELNLRNEASQTLTSFSGGLFRHVV